MALHKSVALKMQGVPLQESLLKTYSRRIQKSMHVVEPLVSATLRYDVVLRPEVVSLSDLPGVIGLLPCSVGDTAIGIRFDSADFAAPLVHRLQHSTQSTLLIGGDRHKCLNRLDLEEDEKPHFDVWHLDVFNLVDADDDGEDGSHVVVVHGRPTDWTECFSHFDMSYRMDPVKLQPVPKRGTNVTKNGEYQPLSSEIMGQTSKAAYYYRGVFNLLNINRDKRPLTLINIKEGAATEVLDQLFSNYVFPRGSLSLWCIDCSMFVAVGMEFSLSYSLTWRGELKINSFKQVGIFDTAISIGMATSFDLELDLPLFALRIPKKGQSIGTIIIPIATATSIKISPALALDVRFEISATAFAKMRGGFALNKYVERGSQYSGVTSKWSKINKDGGNGLSFQSPYIYATGTLEPKFALAPVVLFKVGLNVLLEVASVNFEVTVVPFIVFKMTFPGEDGEVDCRGRAANYDLLLEIVGEFSINRITILTIRLDSYIPFIPYTYEFEIFDASFRSFGCSACSGCFGLSSLNLLEEGPSAASLGANLLPAAESESVIFALYPGAPIPEPADDHDPPPSRDDFLDANARFDFNDFMCSDKSGDAADPRPYRETRSRCLYCGLDSVQVDGGCAYCPDTLACRSYPSYFLNSTFDDTWELGPLGTTSCPSAWIPVDDYPYYMGYSSPCPAEEYAAPFNVTVRALGPTTPGEGYCVAEEPCEFSWTYTDAYGLRPWYLKAEWTFSDLASFEALRDGLLAGELLPGLGLPAAGELDYSGLGSSPSNFSFVATPSAVLAARRQAGEALSLALQFSDSEASFGQVAFSTVLQNLEVRPAAGLSGFDWVYSSWGVCSFFCGESNRTRTVACYDLATGAVSAAANCNASSLEPLQEACNNDPCVPTVLEPTLVQPRPGTPVNLAPPPTGVRPYSDLVRGFDLGVANLTSGSNTTVDTVVTGDLVEFAPVLDVEWGGGTGGGVLCEVLLECARPVAFNETLAVVPCVQHSFRWNSSAYGRGCGDASLTVRELLNATAVASRLSGLVIRAPRTYSLTLFLEAPGCPNGAIRADVVGVEGGARFDFVGHPGGPVTVRSPGAVAAIDPVFSLEVTTDSLLCNYVRVLRANMSDELGSEWEWGVFADLVLKTGTYRPGLAVQGINGDVASLIPIESQSAFCEGGHVGCAARKVCSDIPNADRCNILVGCLYDVPSNCCQVVDQQYNWVYPDLVSSASFFASIF